MATLTPEQRQKIQQAGEQPIEVTDPQTNDAYYLIRSDLYRELRELMDEERQRAGIAKKAKRNAAARMDEP